MKIKKLVMLVVYCLLAVYLGYGQQRFIEVDRELTRQQHDGAFSGSVLVAKKGKILYHKNVGMADIEHKVAVTDNTAFELASVTKTFTALLVLQLAESGKVRLDAKVADYVPEFTRNDSGEITLHHLLSHTSGLQDFVGLNCDFANWSDKEFLDGLEKTPIRFKPGSRFEYASSTYILLRLVIERVTGQSYESNLQQHIFKPAGMTHSGVIHNRQIIPDRALGYQYSDRGYQHALPIANHNIFAGAASIYSTTTDLLRFDQALYRNELLSERSKQQMFSIVLPPYGYGWFISDDPRNGKIISHGGDIFGYTTLIERRLKDHTLIVILGNLQSIDREVIVKLLNKTLQ